MATTPKIQDKVKDLLKTRSIQNIEEQIDEARRIVSEIDKVDSYAAFARISARIRTNERPIKLLQLLTRVAAILFIPLSLASGWLFYKQYSLQKPAELAMQEITSPAGIRSQVVLPDGSKVWLNAESTLKFPVPFQEDMRNVDLKGEAFFEVTKNEKKPFVVQSGDVKVKVLGTRFDCKAFEEDKTIEVILEEGKVSLNSSTNNEDRKAILKSGDRAVIEKTTGELKISNEDIGKYIAWHQGKLVFANTPMAEVAQMLGRWYGIEIEIKDKSILDYRFTTTFNNESIFNVIELLELSSPIRMKYIPATIGIDNKLKTKAKVILTKK